MPDAKRDVSAIGEVMLRMSVPVGQRIETADRLDLFPGGAEANVTNALSWLGRRTAYASALPDNPLGRRIANQLRMAGVNLDTVVWRSTGRVGTYYVEFAQPPMPIRVTYDRADSCAAQMQPGDFDWSALLDTRLIHLTGITAALSEGCYATTREAIQKAKAAGVAVSFDVNYRAKLWKSTGEAAEALLPLMQGVDVLFCKLDDARNVFGLVGDAHAVLRALAERTGATNVITTRGAQGVIAWNGEQVLEQSAIPVVIVDRLGAGDALAAGVLHGWLDGDLASGLRYGVTLASIALSQHGDFLVTSPAEVASLLEGVGNTLQR